jgi:hypothetical protein
MTSAATHCAKCGKPRDPAAAYCEYCGASAADPPSGGQQTLGAPSRPPTVPQPPRTGTGQARVSTSLTQRRFFSSLFDLSFTSLITTKIIKVLYLLSILLIGLTAAIVVLAAFHQSSVAGLLVLVVIAPIVSLFYLIYTRVVLELVIALFRIMENTGELVAQGRRDL